MINEIKENLNFTCKERVYMKKVRNYVAVAMAALMVAAVVPAATVNAAVTTATAATAVAGQSITIDSIGSNSVTLAWTADESDSPINGYGTGCLYMTATYPVNDSSDVHTSSAGFTGTTISGLKANTTYSTDVIKVVVNHGISNSTKIGTVVYTTAA